MADPTPPGEPVERLIQAVREGRADEVQLLVDANPALAAARDVSGVSAVVLALYHGHRDIAGWLSARRSDLDVFEAACLGDLSRATTLLSSQPSLAAAWSPDGFTALGLAAFFGHLPVVQRLLAAGADANAVGGNAARYTPLTGAVAGRHVEVARELLRAGADPNYRYGAQLTPLHVAAANGSGEIVQALLDAGAAPDARDAEGRTAIDYARGGGHARIAGVLAGHTATVPRD